MKSNYDGSEYGQVTVGRGKAVHYGNVEDNMTACGKRGYLEDGVGWEVTCKVCVKMAETTHDGSRPLIKDEQPAAPVAPAEPAQELLFTCFECEGEHVGTFAGYSIYGGAALYEVTCDRDNLSDRYTLDAFWKPMPETSLGLDLTPPAPAEPEPLTGAQTAALRLVTENGGAATVREVAQALTGNVRPDAVTSRRVQGVLRSLVQHGHLAVTREGGKVTYRLPTQAETMLPEALTAVTEAARTARQLFDAYTATDRYDQKARSKAYAAWGLACLREVKMRQQARSLGATVDETYAAMIAGIRQVDPNY